jgi:hypothetical protein
MKELFNNDKLRIMEDELKKLFPALNIRLTYSGSKYHLDAQLPSNYYLPLLRLIVNMWYPEGTTCFPDFGDEVFWFKYRKERLNGPEIRFTKSGELTLYDFTNLLKLKQYFQILVKLCNLANRNFISYVANLEK